MLTNVEEAIQELRTLPDFNRLTFPKDWYEKYSIPKPEILSFSDYLNLNLKIQLLPSEHQCETRPPASGGVRTLPESKPVEIIVESKPDDTKVIKTTLPSEITEYIELGLKAHFKQEDK